MKRSISKSYSLAAILFFLVGRCMADSNSSNQLIDFNVGKTGATASIAIHISDDVKMRTDNNPREISMMIIPPKMNGNNDELWERYKSLFKSLTGKNYIYSGDMRPTPHEGIKVRVTWKNEEENTLRERDVYSDDGNSRIRVTYGAAFTLDGMVLGPRNYTVTVEALEDDPRFDGEFKTAICSGYIVN